ncbi:MAG: sulfatase-like hydrolase/transferase [Bacteroidales bacterium]
MKNVYGLLLIFLTFFMIGCKPGAQEKKARPNVLWIVIEDASCHISCYGETAIETPHIDALAGDGVRFEKAFTTAAVCSPVRSALVLGMYQTTAGAHNHRSQVKEGKGGGNVDYYESFALPPELPLASRLFEQAGYYTSNEKLNGETGKTDYNFVAENAYSGTSWKACPEGSPFFSQIQLHGGKNRNRVAETEDFSLPPYYFEDEIMRKDWKEYLGSWLDTDDEVGKIVVELKSAGVYDQTLIVLLTDHGISHMRGKQFLYDEGIRVPLIVKFPEGKQKGKVRSDMVKHIDILPTSLAIAGIDIPAHLQGADLYADAYESQEYIYTTRDRCDETTEIIRSVRTDKYKYIRNFLSYRPHAQRNQYKDGKLISRHMRELWEEGRLNELQSRYYQPTRPVEELYDLEKDPFEINNLAGDPAYYDHLEDLRSRLYSWMTDSHDPALIPEPLLEEMGKEHGSKYAAMKQEGMDQLTRQLIAVIEHGEQQNNAALIQAIESEEPAMRYWGATWLGVNGVETAKKILIQLTSDADPSVRIASNLALYRIDPSYDPIPALAIELEHPNLIVGLFAIAAIEQTEIRSEAVKAVAEIASQSKYEFTKRYGTFLSEDRVVKQHSDNSRNW